MEYRIVSGDSRLRLGTQIDIETLTFRGNNSQEIPQWIFPAGVYRAKDIVRETSTLLEAVCMQLGESAAAEPLLRNLQSNLAVSGRDAVLPLALIASEDETKSTFLDQAEKIGTKLSSWAREIYFENPARQKYGEKALLELIQRSQCDNHRWTPEVASILMGPKGSPEIMQLFNEYLHQLILLRDALIPFENWEEVPLVIVEGDQAKGLRFIEPARNRFLTELMVKQMPHREVVRFAQSFLSPELSTVVGYGFQYRLGMVLPAAIGKPITATKSLLCWHPAHLLPYQKAGESDSVVFDYAEGDYYAASRSRIGSRTSKQQINNEISFQNEIDIVPEAIEQGRVILNMRLSDGNYEYRVDVGQAMRGHRYMYRREQIAVATEITASQSRSEWIEHAASEILGAPGLATFDEEGVHYISVGGNPLVVWALLGKLFPLNVVVIVDEQADGVKAPLLAGNELRGLILLNGSYSRQVVTR
ncbi:hypothetical protein [Paenibacillus sp. MDMC362]|uniref:hypothetical protein n=1 Tax=Paenibacillus sp. MDMC362 TaxID=2977365 RepID=UPI000DC60556|nr:hypothetical protein [Paenibacillus sp. MDMC362]RAR40648.1 hypothetical protein DP091_27635 [Paenibacillus sp. MDMC362]